MKERPILMSAPMVRALLEGRKTQTRRAIKHPRHTGAFVCVQYPPSEQWWPFVSVDGESNTDPDGNETPMNCPYGKVGDRIWVREAFWSYESKPKAFAATSSGGGFLDPSVSAMTHSFTAYRAAWGDEKPEGCNAWKSPIFMPRKLSRITLEITEIRVERLQKISEADVEAEGVALVKTNCDGECGETPCGIARWNYSALWEDINGKGSWESNPFVWALTFKVVKP